MKEQYKIQQNQLNDKCFISQQMDNSRQIKQSPLQMKKRMIETRGQSKIVTTQRHNPNSQKQVTINNTLNVVQDLPTFKNNQTNSKISSVERKSLRSHEKQTGRLKLKDYLHLNNLEKKTHERKSNSSSKNISRNSIEPIKSNKKIQGKAEQKELSQAQRIRNYENILKKEIEVMVVEEAQKFKQIQQYFQNEFQPNNKAKETFYYLFQIYNSLMQIEVINQKIGETIFEYQQPKQEFKKKHGIRFTRFWERTNPTISKNKQTINQIIRNSNRQA